MFFLNENNGCNQQYICNNLAIDKTAMVKVIDYLIKVGFVDRNVNPDDRREHFIVLTKKGLKQTAEIVKAFEDIWKNNESKGTFHRMDKSSEGRIKCVEYNPETLSDAIEMNIEVR